jgi:cobaltochelatase CobN
MHRLNTTSGGWNPQSEDVIVLEQTPAPLVFITAADTDIQTLAAATSYLPTKFPQFRVANLLQLQHQISIDIYAEQVLELAQIIILRLLGGRSYWSYGLEVVQELAERSGKTLIIIPGDDGIDPDLISHSTLPLNKVHQVWRYFNEGGVENIVNALLYIADTCLLTSFNPPSPQVVPRVGLYGGEWGVGEQGSRGDKEAKYSLSPSPLSPSSSLSPHSPHSPLPRVGILFYRAHYLAGNTKVIDALCAALAERNLEPVPVFVSSLREVDVQTQLSELFRPQDATKHIGVLLNTTSFSLARLDVEKPQLQLWQEWDVPVLQVILSGGSLEQWESQFQGLSPRDMAMNVALPEVDGRIISRAVSFKTLEARNPHIETDVVVYEPVRDRIEFVADLANNWVRLRSKPPQERRIALILANYPNRDGRIANGVGLDTPASCVEILQAMKSAGYQVENIPVDGKELIQSLTAGVTNDVEGRELRPIWQSVSLAEYQEYFNTLPEEVKQGIGKRWGTGGDDGVSRNFDISPAHASRLNGGNPRTALAPLLPCSRQSPQRGEPPHGAGSPAPVLPSFPIPGIQLGNVFVGIQPARGYELDPSLNYHAPDLEPTHAYLAFYYWVRQCFGADAVVHVGKHGNLEWLPGKSVALSSCCYPEVALGAIPHLYPFIVNDPGEGSQAKRRAQAVILDHLTPPLTRAELYGSLQQLENLIDEYYEADSLDPGRLPTICERIGELVRQESLDLDLGLTNGKEQLPINKIDGYLCELKEAQIRDGLHIFGQCPQGSQLRDLIVAIARHPHRHSPGLTRALAEDFGLDFDPLTEDFSYQLSAQASQILANKTQHSACRTVGDAVEVLEHYATILVEDIIQNSTSQISHPKTELVLDWIRSSLLPAVRQTPEEITNLLRGLDGRYVPSAPAGAPTRGRPEVLPTGKNFYSVDIRAIPTETAWDVGRKAAETLIEYYTQKNGEYPKTLGLSLWGTATMRTGGDDIAEALALLGVQPVWDGAARRVVDFEILPLSVLGRPRVDVTLRISGFFRDAFPNLIDLFDQAVLAVAALDEPSEQNPLANQVRQETQMWSELGLSVQEAKARSLYRIFGSKPGAYGAGLQGLIESQNWSTDQDLALAYMNWSSYAYTSGRGAGEQRLDSLRLRSGQAARRPGAQEHRSTGAQEQGSREAEGQDYSLSPSSPPSPPSPSSPHSPLPSPEAFAQRLRNMQIVLHNQDNREHDLLDSDDYYQFQGGLAAAVRAMGGKNPQIYFGDHSIPENPRVRQLSEEIARVYRSRVVNPKWIAGVMRHGYKGAFEMSATVDFLFAYDVTTKCVEDYMYQGVAQAYLFDTVVLEFIQEHNPYALRDIAERLLEAHKRGLWQDVSIQTLDNLRNLVHQAEAVIEEKSVV